MGGHTLGPWKRSKLFPDTSVHNGEDGDAYIPIAEIRSGDPGDAKLIAAAPELLHAAKLAREALDPPETDLEYKAFDACGDAIHKAVYGRE